MLRALLVCTLLCAGAPGVNAARVEGLYEATVPLAERSERGQAEALQAALRQVRDGLREIRDLLAPAPKKGKRK